MQAFQERVVAEKADLDKKREALRTFMFSDEHRKLLRSECKQLSDQLEAMDRYSAILLQRIAAFEAKPKSDRCGGKEGEVITPPKYMHEPCEQCKSDFPYAPLVHGRHICKSCAAKMDTPKPDLHRLHRDDNSFVGDMEGFEKGLTDLINRHSIENMVDMPDYLLSEMICRMINAMGPDIKKTLNWHKCRKPS